MLSYQEDFGNGRVLGIDAASSLIFINLILLRPCLGLLAIAMVVLAHTPYCFPTFLFAFAPFIALWRGRASPNSRTQVSIESLLIGIATGWLSTHFVEDAVGRNGWLLLGVCCLIYSCQTIGLGLTIWFTRQWKWMVAISVCTLVAVGLEMLQAYLVGVTWVLVNPPLGIANTPISQWAAYLSSFGLSATIYLISLSWWPNFSEIGLQRYGSTILAGGLTCGLWFSGIWIESRVEVRELPFSAMLVQPDGHGRFPIAINQKLRELTCDSFDRNGPVDLVVWPENCMSHEQNATSGKGRIDFDEVTRQATSQNSLHAFMVEFMPRMRANFLLGIKLTERGSRELGNSAAETFVCGVLASSSEDIQSHEKQVLIPIREGMPDWLKDSVLRSCIASMFNMTGMISVGRHQRLLGLTDSAGQLRQVACAVCYESWFPWLPQYHSDRPVDAICHLAYDGEFIENPELVQRMLLTIRLRAIETRTWQLVCSHFAGTAVIDPRGRIVKQLPPGPGVLRTDRME